MKIERKHIIAGGLALISIAAAAAYLQYKKLMNYKVSFKNVQVKNFGAKLVNVDLFINFLNNSDVKFTIEGQEYDVYVNDIFITKVTNTNSAVINPKATSAIGINIKFDPSSIAAKMKGKGAEMLLNIGNTRLKVDMKLKVALWFFTVNVPYVYQSTLKEMMASEPAK